MLKFVQRHGAYFDLMVSKSISIVNVYNGGELNFVAFISLFFNSPLFFLLYIYAFLLYIPLWNINYFLFLGVELKGLKNNPFGVTMKGLEVTSFNLRMVASVVGLDTTNDENEI